MDKSIDEGRTRRGLSGMVRSGLTRPWHVELNCETLAWLAVAVGVVLRVWEYLGFRELYIDEVSLLRNIENKSIFDFFHMLEEDQMAPPGFLVIERLLVHLPMEVKRSARLLPLFCGIASVFLMRSTARRYLDRRAVPIAVAILALGDHLIYYASEIKQYSTDLLFAQLALLLAAPPPPQRMSPRHLVALAVFGMVASWFAFPIVFVLGGIGLHFLVTEARRRDWRRVAFGAAMGVAWLASFAACFLLSRSIMSKRDFLWIWWNFAFLPLPPRNPSDVQLLVETLANVFINPASLLSPLSFPYTAGAASVLALIGCVALGRRWPGGLFLLISPLVLGLAASGLHQYPFHGRLVLYLVPTYLMLLAEGIAAVGRPTGWLVTLALAGFFLYGQAAELAWQTIVHRTRGGFDSHGDLKHDLLDYLEYERTLKTLRSRKAPPSLDPNHRSGSSSN
jgi:hypothetical protein